MKELDYLKDMLCKELSKITQQNDFTTSTLETSFKIVDMLKDIEATAFPSFAVITFRSPQCARA